MHFKLNGKVAPRHEAYFSFLIKKLTIASDLFHLLEALTIPTKKQTQHFFIRGVNHC